MGLEKLDIQKSKLKTVFTSMINATINIMRLQLTLTDKPEDIQGLKSYIRCCEEAIETINSVSHYEILVSLYNTFINGKESYFVAIVNTINNKKTIARWDRSKKGFAEFLKLEQEAKAKSKQEMEERRKMQEEIEKARAEGKKIEMVYENGKLKPRIVNEIPN